MGNTPYIVGGLIIAACIGLVIVAIHLKKRSAAAFRKNLAAVAAEMELTRSTSVQWPAFYGSILNWPVQLELQKASAFPPGSPMHTVLTGIGLLGALVGSGGARAMAAAGRAKQEIVVLTIDGAERPDEFDKLFSALDWEDEAKPWRWAFVPGERRVRWVQTITASQKALAGMSALDLVARTLNVAG